MMALGATPSRRGGSRRNQRGAVTVEYVVLVGTVGLGLAFAVAFLGPHLVGSYVHARDTLIWPMP